MSNKISKEFYDYLLNDYSQGTVELIKDAISGFNGDILEVEECFTTKKNLDIENTKNKQL